MDLTLEIMKTWDAKFRHRISLNKEWQTKFWYFKSLCLVKLERPSYPNPSVFVAAIKDI